MLYNAFNNSTLKVPGPAEICSACSAAILYIDTASINAFIDGSSDSTKLATIAPNKQPAPVIFANNEDRSEEHTSELQSRFDLVCRLLLEKKKERRQYLYVTQTAPHRKPPLCTDG